MTWLHGHDDDGQRNQDVDLHDSSTASTTAASGPGHPRHRSPHAASLPQIDDPAPGRPKTPPGDHRSVMPVAGRGKAGFIPAWSTRATTSTRTPAPAPRRPAGRTTAGDTTGRTLEGRRRVPAGAPQLPADRTDPRRSNRGGNPRIFGFDEKAEIRCLPSLLRQDRRFGLSIIGIGGPGAERTSNLPTWILPLMRFRETASGLGRKRGASG